MTALSHNGVEDEPRLSSSDRIPSPAQLLPGAPDRLRSNRNVVAGEDRYLFKSPLFTPLENFSISPLLTNEVHPTTL
jgi:hypothetical protein